MFSRIMRHHSIMRMFRLEGEHSGVYFGELCSQRALDVAFPNVFSNVFLS